MKALLGMYSLREAMAEDLEGTLAQAKALGFDGIELAWYAGHPVEKVREAVQKLGLEVWSCHTDIKEMLADPHKNFSDIVSLGAKYVIICHMRDDERPDGEHFAEAVADVQKLEKLAREEYGLTMLYHNHDFDLKVLPDGRYSLDASYEAFPVGGELDTCWVELCGASTVDFLHRYPGKIPLMHIKDYRRSPAPAGWAEPAPGCEFCPLGWGEIDFAAIFAAAEETGVKGVILELDEPGCGKTAQECVELSAAEMKRLLGRA